MYGVTYCCEAKGLSFKLFHCFHQDIKSFGVVKSTYIEQVYNVRLGMINCFSGLRWFDAVIYNDNLFY
ncbi:hypothetical protein BOH74_04785 [Pseudomonas versuta]|uniref:Uncharacterized protein n=1 Tax=Pseudomonas versuta TaxID=1788301 RepID=A0A853ZZ29_9PSED|nr:hypothetical protein BOH74_04785 [Pseudomonas versuta]